jgi:RND family efflux transporter MFP subunit
VRQAEANLATARGGRSRYLVAQGQVTSALAALGQAQAGLRTSQANLAEIPISQQETRVAREAVQQARAGLLQARANRSQIPVAREDVNAARAAVQAAQAALRQTQVNLAYARIYSPVNGVVNQKLTGPGQTAGQGGALMNLVSLERVYFEAQVSENSIGSVRAGQAARITAAAVSDQPLQGVVTDIIPTADARTRQFRVRISIPNAPRELTPGAFARATLNTQVIRNTLIVPTSAIQLSNNQAVIFLAQEQGKAAQVKRRVVRAGAAANGQTQIVGGVQKGDLIITGNNDLADGDKINIAKNA